MRLLLILFGSIILSSCYYSDGCIHTPQMVNCYYENSYPDLIRFAKKNSYTDKNTRLKDVLSCGGTVDKGWIIKNLPKTPGSYYNFKERNKFMDCMKNKGYIFIDEYSCWKNNICE